MRSADIRVQDPLALAEIELYAELVIAASASPDRMSLAAIDEVLGVPSVRQIVLPDARRHGGGVPPRRHGGGVPPRVPGDIDLRDHQIPIRSEIPVAAPHPAA